MGTTEWKYVIMVVNRDRRSF